MSLILSLLRNYEPLPHTSEAEQVAGPSTTTTTIPRPYGYNYATRGNVYDSQTQRRGTYGHDDDADEQSGERPGWDQGRRFRYDPPPSHLDTTAAAATTISTTGRTASTTTPSSSFVSDTDRHPAISSPHSPSSIPVTNNDLGLANLLSPGPSPAPASFFLSKRNPALYPGLKEKLKARRREADA